MPGGGGRVGKGGGGGAVGARSKPTNHLMK